LHEKLPIPLNGLLIRFTALSSAVDPALIIRVLVGNELFEQFFVIEQKLGDQLMLFLVCRASHTHADHKQKGVHRGYCAQAQHTVQKEDRKPGSRALSSDFADEWHLVVPTARITP
jgi:hypothetical protein